MLHVVDLWNGRAVRSMFTRAAGDWREPLLAGTYAGVDDYVAKCMPEGKAP